MCLDYVKSGETSGLGVSFITLTMDDCFWIALLIYASFIRSTWSFNNFFIYFVSNRLMIQSFEELLKINYIINY